MIRRSAGQKGFSLIELIVVMVILGLLASIVGPRVLRWPEKSKVKIARLQLADLRSSLAMFRLEVGRFPTSTEGLQSLIEDPGVSNWGGPYLDKKVIPKDPWGREYEYRSPGQHDDYDLWSLGADGVEGGEGNNADVTSWK